jgi:hypothetical protein
MGAITDPIDLVELVLLLNLVILGVATLVQLGVDSKIDSEEKARVKESHVSDE